VAAAAELDGLPEELDILGFDPQTAGGLLVSIPAEKGPVLEASLTGSGLGCENWPRCGSSFLPEKNFHALVEYGNRGVGFVVGLVTLAAAIGATRVERLPRWLLWAAWALPVTVLLQGVLGGITVLVELHPLIVMAHFLLSLLALGVAVVVAFGAHDFVRG